MSGPRPFLLKVPFKDKPTRDIRPHVYGGPDAHTPDDCLELHSPNTDLPPIFWRIHQLEIRRGCECMSCCLEPSTSCSPTFHTAASPAYFPVSQVQRRRRREASV